LTNACLYVIIEMASKNKLQIVTNSFFEFQFQFFILKWKNRKGTPIFISKKFFKKLKFPLDNLPGLCYTYYRKKRKGYSKMANFYTVSTFRADVNFSDLRDAEKYFEANKERFTYCELKAVEISAAGYRSESIKIYWR